MAEPQTPLEVAKESLPETLPVLPLYDAVLFPKMVIPLVVLQVESIKLVDEAMTRDRIVGLLVSKKSADQKPEPKSNEESGGKVPEPPTAVTSDTEKTDPEKDLYQIGTTALILKLAKTEEDRAQLLVQGMNRFRVKGFEDGKTYLQAKVEYLEDVEDKGKETMALVTNLLGLFSKVVELSPALPQEMGAMAKTIQEPGILANVIASTINTSVAEKQNVLEIDDVKLRLKEITRLVNYQLEILELGHKIQSQVKGDMEKKQKEYYLRQQLEAIKEELGEKDDSGVELEEYRAKIEEKNLPEEAKKEDLEQVKKDTIEEFIRHAPFEVPNSMVEKIIRSEIKRIKESNPDEAFEENAFRSQMRPDAVRAVQTYLISDAIKKQQGIEVTKEEVDSRIETLAKINDMKPREFRRKLIKEGKFEELKNTIVQEKVEGWLIEVTDVTDEIVRKQTETSRIVKP